MIQLGKCNRERIPGRILLRVFLLYSAIGWGVCVVGIFVSGPVAFDLVAIVGGINPDALLADPMYDYWLRMASGAFALIGGFFLVLAVWPRKFAAVLPLAGLFMLLEGIILMAHGLRLHLPSTPFLGDAGFCLIGGLGILFCMSSVRFSVND